MPNNLQVAADNIPPHQLRLGRAGEDVLIPGHKQRRDINRLQISDRVGTFRHASLNLGDIPGRHLSHHPHRALYQVFLQVRDAAAKILEHTTLADIVDPKFVRAGKRLGKKKSADARVLPMVVPGNPRRSRED